MEEGGGGEPGRERRVNTKSERNEKNKVPRKRMKREKERRTKNEGSRE